MSWRNGLQLLFWVLMGIVFLPMIVLLVCIVLLFVFILFLITLIKDLFIEGWNHLPRNRRAISRAQEVLESRLPGRAAVNWHVARRDWQKCFVQATLAGMTQPPTLWLCAVWDSTGEVDELGTWQFHHGLGVRHAARAYDRSRAAGQAWPKGVAELVAQVPAAELPATARPGLHPHEGTVMLRRQGQISFYAFAEVISEVLTPDDIEGVEAYDAECRRLHLSAPRIDQPPVVLTPFPPTKPDKVFIERLRHHLMSRTTDAALREQMRQMLPAELADHGIRHFDYEEAEPEVE
jgi:hypothetical protein